VRESVDKPAHTTHVYIHLWCVVSPTVNVSALAGLSSRCEYFISVYPRLARLARVASTPLALHARFTPAATLTLVVVPVTPRRERVCGAGTGVSRLGFACACGCGRVILIKALHLQHV